MFTGAYLEPSRTSMMELFSLQLNHILKTKLNSIKLPLGCILLHNSVFHEKKLTTVKTSEEKAFC